MTDCRQELFEFPSFDRRKIEASFTGGDVSSDGGIFLVRQADRLLGVTAALAHNTRLKAMLAPQMLEAEAEHQRTKEKVRLFTDLEYAARTWDKTRRVITRAEHTDEGSNPRFVVTNLEGEAQALDDEIYCARGERENRIKE